MCVCDVGAIHLTDTFSITRFIPGKLSKKEGKGQISAALWATTGQARISFSLCAFVYLCLCVCILRQCPGSQFVIYSRP